MCMCMLVIHLCLSLCDPMDYSLPGSSIHGIFQARIMEWVAIAFSVHFIDSFKYLKILIIGTFILGITAFLEFGWKSLGHVWLFVTSWTIQSMNSPGPNTGVGSLSCLQRIFPTQGLKPGLTYCRQILYHLSHKGSPRILEWVAYPFSSVPSQLRNRTRVSCIEGRFLVWFSLVQLLSRVRLCDPMNRSTSGLPVHHKLPEFTQTHTHWVSDAIQPSHPLSSPSPPAPNPSKHQGLFQWVNSSHRVAKVLEFHLQHQSFQWTPRSYLLQDGLVGSPFSPRDSQECSPTQILDYFSLNRR